MKDQEKVALQQKSAKEAEQERQWKQLQAMRQQQAQQQQHVIHEQRVQGILNFLFFYYYNLTQQFKPNRAMLLADLIFKIKVEYKKERK